MSNAYFGNKNAKQSLVQLAATADGIFVSEETINDYQLHIGDLINLRLQNAQDHQYHTVPFHLIGMVKEFPTAPKDSFLVANASYIAKQTGSSAAEIVMMRTNGNPTELVKTIQPIVQSLSGARITDLGSTQKTISSSLTAVNLQGLSRLETVFAVLMATGFTGLIFALGLSERRRTFAILSALGATKKQLGYFIWSEGLLILIGGGICGIGLGFGIAEMFIKVLTGVFDPPPEFLNISVGYLAVLVVSSVLATVVAVYTVRKVAQSQVIKALRNPNLYF
jgi:putative ABC transport system permease protein